MNKTLPLINAIVSGAVIAYCFKIMFCTNANGEHTWHLALYGLLLLSLLFGNVLLFGVSIHQYRQITQNIPLQDEDTIYIATGCIWFPLTVILFFLLA